MENIDLAVSPRFDTLRCKMNINAVKDVGGSIRVEMGAVYSSRPDSENKSFSDATPCAFFSMDISKKTPAANAEWLQPGAQVYVDLRLADIPEWNWAYDRYPEVGRRIELRLDSLNAESQIGIYTKEPDEEFQRIANNNTLYPILQCGDKKVPLYLNTHNIFPFYWKYV